MDIKKSTLSPILKREKELLAERPSAVKKLNDIESELKKIKKIKILFGQLYPEPKMEAVAISHVPKKGWKMKRFKSNIKINTSSPDLPALPNLTKSEKKFLKMLKSMGENVMRTKDINIYNEKTTRFTVGMASFLLTQLKNKNRIKNVSVGKWQIL